jgi:glucosamine 6-phosphate synthetase-like amidotransferase/phosphosugar isomerase protein
VLIEGADDLILGARRGSPLVVGEGEGEMFLGSDALAVGPFTNRVSIWRRATTSPSTTTAPASSTPRARRS